jgi:hypothetical protein
LTQAVGCSLYANTYSTKTDVLGVHHSWILTQTVADCSTIPLEFLTGQQWEKKKRKKNRIFRSGHTLSNAKLLLRNAGRW